MSYTYGEKYYGLTLADYDLLDDNETIREILEQFLILSSDGSFYVVKPGIDQEDFFDQMEENGIEGYIRFFTYLKSTWGMQNT